MNLWPCLLLPIAACAPPELDLPLPNDLPDSPTFRTETDTFNRAWMFALRDGRVWMAGNPDSDRGQFGWELLGATGLPEGPGIVNTEPPEAVVEISSDGVHLTAIAEDGQLYRATNMQTDVRRDAIWTDRWGWPAARGDGLQMDAGNHRGWAVSDSHPSNVKRYTDIVGVDHLVGAGVAHIYRLGPGGRSIAWNDWWLPRDWSRHICGPERNGVELARLSASGSTLFVIGVDGSLHTRLYDFDTAGENDLYTYSFLDTDHPANVRALPAEPWARQPDPDGRLTDRITIFQDGAGNEARVLRVEGERDGITGYFEKRIDAEQWAFVETDLPLGGTPIDEWVPDAAEPLPWPEPVDVEATLTREDREGSLSVHIAGFDLFCSPWQATISDGEQTWDTELHLVHTTHKEVRDDDWWQTGGSSSVRAALVVPQDAPAMLDDHEIVNLMGEATADGVVLTEIWRGKLYRVPRNEKAKKGELLYVEQLP